MSIKACISVEIEPPPFFGLHFIVKYIEILGNRYAYHMCVYINIVGETCSQTPECDDEQETHHDQSNVYWKSAGWRLETKVSLMKFI